jgi:hypothetical protein
MDPDPPLVMAITWRKRDRRRSGRENRDGFVIIEYAEGSATSEPMSQADARDAAHKAFGADPIWAVFDGGCRWMRAQPDEADTTEE